MARLGLICAAMMLVSPAMADVSFSGTVVPETAIELRAARDGMLVSDLFAQSGDRVAAGTILARLESHEQAAALKGAEAELARSQAEVAAAMSNIQVAESDLRIAEGQASRSGKLGARGAISAEVAEQDQETRVRAAAVLVRSRAELSVAQASVALARANVETARLHVLDTEIKAPVDGLILSRAAKIGSVAASLFHLARNGDMIVEATVLDPDFQQVRPGMAVRIRFADGREMAGDVESVGGSVDPVTRLGQVRIQLQGTATAGSFVSGEILSPRTQASLP